MIPGPWATVILALAAYRLTRLIGWDDLPPIEWARARLVGETWDSRGSTNSQMGLSSERADVAPRYRRPTLNHFVRCAFCQGFWTAGAVYLVWALAAGHPGAEPWRSWILYPLAPLALGALVGLIAKNLDP